LTVLPSFFETASKPTLRGSPPPTRERRVCWSTVSFDALADFAFEGSLAGKALAYPKTVEALSLGNWVGMCSNYSPLGHCLSSVTGSTGTPPYK